MGGAVRYDRGPLLAFKLKALAFGLLVCWPGVLVVAGVVVARRVLPPLARRAYRHPRATAAMVSVVAFALRCGVIEAAGFLTGLTLALALTVLAIRGQGPALAASTGAHS